MVPNFWKCIQLSRSSTKKCINMPVLYFPCHTVIKCTKFIQEHLIYMARDKFMAPRWSLIGRHARIISRPRKR